MFNFSTSMVVEVIGKGVVRSGVSSKTNQPWKMIEQEAVWHNGSQYPEKIKINVPSDVGDAGYGIGVYFLDISRSVRRAQFDAVRVFDAFLIPFTPEEVKAFRKQLVQVAA